MSRFLAAAVLLLDVAQAYTDRGILKLDNTTFDRIVDGSKNVLVRFDKEYSYGDDHDAWKEFAKTVGESSADAMICDVGVSEYGDKDNKDIADRFGVSSDNFPTYLLWKKGESSAATPKKFDGNKKSDEFLRFLQSEAGVWVGLPGQIKEFDALAKEFKGASDKAKIKGKAEAAAKKVDEKDTDAAKYYVKVMTKAAADTGFIEKETARLKKMMDDGSVKAAKKEQFGRRLNMLSSFS
jgi:endoplasmic reticulum protein 29